MMTLKRAIFIACFATIRGWYINPDICNVTIPHELYLCGANESYSCYEKKSPNCPDEITVSMMENSPFHEILTAAIKSVVGTCCDPCQKMSVVRNYANTVELFYRIENGTENSDIIFPVLGSKSTKTLYSRYFIPTIDMSKATFITVQRNATVIMNSIIESCFSLLPLLAVCLLMALASGIIIWLLDTWSNEQQFPRKFVFGIYEGFWWAFISMTTVGYGDKAPLSILARLFGIFWIIIGITICSMFTASLTAVITNAGKPPTTDLAGKKIIIMENRILDATFVLSAGGVIYKEVEPYLVGPVAESDSEVDGFVTDFITAASFRKYSPEIAKRYDYQDIDFQSLGYSYGILIKDVNLYTFLKTYFDDNRMFYTNCYIQDFNQGLNRGQLSSDPFNPNNGMFLKSVIFLTSIFVMFFILGSIFECVRRYRQSKFPVHTRSEREIIDDIRTLLDEWNKSEKEKYALTQ